MSTSEIDSILTRVNRLSTDDKKRLIKCVLDSLGKEPALDLTEGARLSVPLDMPTPNSQRESQGSTGERRNALAQELWDSGLNETRELATMIADPTQVREDLMERWVKDIDSWDLCDQCCRNLFHKTPYAYRKAREWSRRPEEFVKRASFSLMTALALHDKAASDDPFIMFLTIIKREAVDERNFVKKAANWALRQIGKRNRNLNRHAIEAAREIQEIDSTSARWIAADALGDLTNKRVQSRIKG